MNVRQLFGIAAFLLVLSGALSAQPDLSRPVPLDSAVIHGVLENELTYYVRHNEEPKERASFYIVQNVGAILEEDDQNGLAHFLEHMAFNGTGHFPGKGIINTLERHGLAFGREVNAYTWFDETVYNITNVPTTNPALLDTCLLILRDWANGLLLTEEEIDNERGVIREEWRTRRNAGFRMLVGSLKHLFQGSKYAERDVIGDLGVIDSSAYQTLRDFYRDWYRTDLQAIVVVGDFDAADMEGKIRTLFSGIPAVQGARPRPLFRVSGNEEPIYGLVTDPEAPASSVSFVIKHQGARPEAKDLAYYRQQYVHRLYNTMFATRISELLRKEDPPFIYGSARYGEFLARELDAYSIDIAANPDEEARGLEAIMIENERVRRHGFTATELERAKANLLTALESAYKKREKRKHDQFCMEYRGHYLTNDPVPGIEFEFGFVKGILPDIDVEEINALPAAWMTKENRVILVAGPEKEGVSHLTEPEALAIVESIESMEVEPYIDEIADTILVKEIPEGSPVVATKEITELDAVEWTLGNGVTVVYRYSDLTKDEVRFTAYSLGGHSLYPIEKLTSAQMVNSFITDFGIGDFDATALKKVLTGKNVSVRPSINRLTEGFSGNCSPDDFETMLQLVYLYFEQPRFEEEAYNAVMQRTRAWLEEAANDPEKAIRDSITIISVDYHPRGLLFDMEYLNSVALETVEEVYLDRLKDASDFKFFFVGYMEPEEARPMIETYLGALRDADRDESWIDHDVDMPEGATVRVIPIKLNEPKSTVHIKYGKEVQHTPENRLYLRIIREVLNIRYIETVREEEGGTYGVGVRHRLSHYPKEKMSLTMQFDCNPDQAEQLIPLIHKEVDSLIDKGPTEGDLAKVVQNLKKQREEGMQQNEFWLGALKAYYYDGINIADPENYERILDEVTVEDIRKAAKEMLEGADTVEITFNPL